MPSPIQEMPESERPLSEDFRVAAKAWVSAQKGYRLLDEMKSATLAKMKQDLVRDQPDITDAKAERIVKSTSEWAEYVEKLVDAEAEANLARVRMRWVEIRFQEWISDDANARREKAMGKQAT